jgi:hypothetical protein
LYNDTLWAEVFAQKVEVVRRELAEEVAGRKCGVLLATDRDEFVTAFEPHMARLGCTLVPSSWQPAPPSRLSRPTSSATANTPA